MFLSDHAFGLMHGRNAIGRPVRFHPGRQRADGVEIVSAVAAAAMSHARNHVQSN